MLVEERVMKLGVALPLSDIGGDPATVRLFAPPADAAGYDHLAAPDHVLGVNVANLPDWGARNNSSDLFHGPFVLLGFLSGCAARIGYSKPHVNFHGRCHRIEDAGINPPPMGRRVPIWFGGIMI